MEKSERIARLILGYISDELDENEKAELMAWIDESEENKSQFEQFTNQESLLEALRNYEKVKSVKKLLLENASSHSPTTPFYRRPFFRTAAAAALILFLGTAIWMQWFDKNSNKPIASKISNSFKNDLSPGTNKAILTLGSGSTIVLDNNPNESIAKQGGTTVTKIDSGRLAYSLSKGEADNEFLFNTLTTPRGGQYQVVLSDGTIVWLNAASSLRYPTNFKGKNRKVELNGEAYFEVAHNATMPFVVILSNSAEVRVLGTHFNIMAYGDEDLIKTTLLEGSVRISKANKSVLLKPSQQAILNKNDEIKLINDVDTEEAIAWKNGFFQFHRANLQTVMKQISRWYDVEISYEGTIPERQFGGNISRSSNASEVLKILELSKVHFRIEGKKIIVAP